MEPAGPLKDAGVRVNEWVCWHTVKRTTVKIPDELDARLRHEARRRGSTISAVTREALEAHLGGGRRRRLAAAGAARSGRRDISERIEEILATEVDPRSRS
jgi:predicted DNA-binding protein